HPPPGGERRPEEISDLIGPRKDSAPRLRDSVANPFENPFCGATTFVVSGRDSGDIRSREESMKIRLWIAGTLVVAAAGVAAGVAAPEMKKWQKGKGWGWVWGPQDEV